MGDDGRGPATLGWMTLTEAQVWVVGRQSAPHGVMMQVRPIGSWADADRTVQP